MPEGSASLQRAGSAPPEAHRVHQRPHELRGWARCSSARATISDAAFVVLDGEADVMIDTPAGPIKVAVLGPNSLVGEMGVMTNSPRSATIVAATQLTTLRIPKEMFMSLVTEFSQFGLAIIRELASRVEHTNRLLAAAQRS